MFQKTKVCTAVLAGLGGLMVLQGAPAFAQQSLERVEITGSSIKRSVSDEGALPITVLKVEELRQSGVTSVEGIVQLLASSQSSAGSSNSIGSSTGGAAFANLRGIGTNKTLILLNGRRVAAFAFGVSSVDLNAIPFAVIDRVEILRDGASALYGTDAIGGVINFITKRNFAGGNIVLEASHPQKTGGKQERASATVGFGDLEKDGVNFWVSFDTQNSDRLRAVDRDFSKTGIIPSKGVSGFSTTTTPANFTQTPTAAGVVPAFPAIAGSTTAPTCKPPLSVVNPNNAKQCVFDFSATIDTLPDISQQTVAGRINFKVLKDSILSAEVMSTDNRNVARVAPDPVSGITITPSNPAYPRTYPGLDTTRNVTAAWRMQSAGPRTNEALSNAQRLVLDLTGTMGAFDYRTGYFYTTNTVSDGAIDGYVSAPFIRAQVTAGNLNPFVDPNAAQLSIIESAKRRGTFATAEGTTQGVDFRVSRELFAMGGGNAAGSIGGELRKESYQYDTDDALVTALSSAGRSPYHVAGKRDVKAVSAELLLPITTMLEMQLQARYDKYSDAGSTFNPKVGLRFQPFKALVMRGSYNTGFRAPALDDIYGPQAVTFAAGAVNDPVLCNKDGTANVAAGGIASRDCGQQVQVLNGGNPNLKPEKAKTFSLGFAIEPAKNLTFSMDYWNIKLKDSINSIDQISILADPAQYGNKIVRCNSLPAASQTELIRCQGDYLNSNAIGYVVTLTDNLGKVNTSGVDFSAGYAASLGAMGSLDLKWDATWVKSYQYQNSPTDIFKENVGRYVDSSPVFRWQHVLGAVWTRGDLSSRLGIRHKTGYTDQNSPTTVVGGPTFYQSVKSYTLVDLSFTGKPIAGLALTAGIKNLFDTDPPFSNQSTRSQRGYDPRYTDPLGRTYFVRGSYTF